MHQSAQTSQKTEKDPEEDSQRGFTGTRARATVSHTLGEKKALGCEEAARGVYL